MKQLFTLLMIICISNIILAQPNRNEQGDRNRIKKYSYDRNNRSILKIRDIEGSIISVDIDGRNYSRTARVIKFEDLSPGFHNFDIYRITRTRSGNTRGRLIFQGNIRIRPGRIYYATVDDYEGLDVQSKILDNNDWINNSNAWMNDNDRNKYRPYRSDDNYDDDEEDYDLKSRDRDRDHHDYNKNNWNHYQGDMSTARFQALVNEVRNTSFESSKLNVIRGAMAQNKLSSNQLLSLLQEFSFESSKLDLAKELYPKIIDRENLYLINSAFSFQSSKDTWSEFLTVNR